MRPFTLSFELSIAEKKHAVYSHKWKFWDPELRNLKSQNPVFTRESYAFSAS